MMGLKDCLILQMSIYIPHDILDVTQTFFMNGPFDREVSLPAA